MSTLVDAGTGRVLGLVDGRGSAFVGAWLAARSDAWREHVQVVAVDPSAAFRKALRTWPPRAAISVDTFLLVKLGNDALTRVGQRGARTDEGGRGRTGGGATSRSRGDAARRRDSLDQSARAADSDHGRR